MSPILLRPIREQFEHDRVIRQLQARWRRKCDVAVNLGSDETVSVRVGAMTLFPDLVLTGNGGGRRLHGVVEVETAESVNHLEAKAEWAHFSKVRGAFYLYVPAGFTDVAERLCTDGGINVTEIWAYYAIGSQVKFSMTYRSPRAKIRAAAIARTSRSAAESQADGKSKPGTAKKRAIKKKVAAKAVATKTRGSGASKSGRTRVTRAAKSVGRGGSGKTAARVRTKKTTSAAAKTASKRQTTKGPARKASARVGKLAARKK